MNWDPRLLDELARCFAEAALEKYWSEIEADASSNVDEVEQLGSVGVMR